MKLTRAEASSLYHQVLFLVSSIKTLIGFPLFRFRAPDQQAEQILSQITDVVLAKCRGSWHFNQTRGSYSRSMLKAVGFWEIFLKVWGLLSVSWRLSTSWGLVCWTEENLGSREPGAGRCRCCCGWGLYTLPVVLVETEGRSSHSAEQVCFQGQGELSKSKRGAPGTQRLNNNNTDRYSESFPKSLKKKEEEKKKEMEKKKKKERKKERPQGQTI